MRQSKLCVGFLFILVTIPSCAPSAPKPVAPTTAIPAPHFSDGTILSMRKVVSSAGSEPWRAALIAAAARTNSTDEGSDSLVEFIVRTDDGATLSFVQDNSLDLHPGDRVVIHREANTQLTRPS